jgi:hypothetical protein
MLERASPKTTVIAGLDDPAIHPLQTTLARRWIRGSTSSPRMTPCIVTHTGSMDSGPAPSGASPMCNCTSGNDGAVTRQRTEIPAPSRATGSGRVRDSRDRAPPSPATRTRQIPCRPRQSAWSAPRCRKASCAAPRNAGSRRRTCWTIDRSISACSVRICRNSETRPCEPFQDLQTIIAPRDEINQSATV